ncbi:hypothetical protein HELRODRAFT_171259 [Helobdella robusta]|uniref:Zinc finger PHD-type domain-containing protein n=1 Tax=Helobdella robusta TaxID=6412 RepID=T1F401_HELRO|nr:hypothetical protein HELRODRAFT_171259 [Helobdella robusta]ESO05606.1 hypothetical protein HELRODRAFT_171259 [Helobdella robusta]
MSSRYSCTKCAKVVPSKELLICACCKSCAHNKCEINDDILEILKNSKGLKWFCHRCFDLSLDIGSLAKSVDNTKNQIVTQLDVLNEIYMKIKLDIDNIKVNIERNESRLDQLDRFDTTVRDGLETCKNELKETYAGIVRKGGGANIDAIRSEVKSFQKALDEANEIKERESNLLMFRLSESDDDRGNVLKILKHLSEDVSDKNVIKVFRLGKRQESVVRPVLIKLDNVFLRDSIMRNVKKFKSLQGFSHVGLSHDLTMDQRQEYKTYVDRAKAMEKEEINRNFLFRVRGQVGRWKIVKLPRKQM